MKTLPALLIILLALFMLIIGYLYHMGMFSLYVVAEENIGPYKYVYKTHMGPYKETGQIGMDVYNNLLEDDIQTKLGLGIYYDNPKNTPADQLRSEMGSIIETSDYEKFETVKEKYSVKEIPETKCMVVRFPIKNNLSYMVGPMKVYPIIEKYMQKMGYKMTEKDVGYEIYDVGNKEILYALPIIK
jgi:DNA gyrase inhibitor GyrI